jgi:hypothetical protein
MTFLFISCLNVLLCFNFRNLFDKRLASNKLFVFQNTSKNLIAHSIYLAGFYQKNLKFDSGFVQEPKEPRSTILIATWVFDK